MSSPFLRTDVTSKTCRNPLDFGQGVALVIRSRLNPFGSFCSTNLLRPNQDQRRQDHLKHLAIFFSHRLSLLGCLATSSVGENGGGVSGACPLPLDAAAIRFQGAFNHG